MVVYFTTCMYGVGFYNLFTVLHVCSGTGSYHVVGHNVLSAYAKLALEAKHCFIFQWD